jgi:hypothetical protein
MLATFRRVEIESDIKLAMTVKSIIQRDAIYRIMRSRYITAVMEYI